jgi:DNA-directed RNA polymerase specialized sigma24 family protein
VLPKSDPLIFDEISTDPGILTARTNSLVEKIDESRWRWADVADDVRKHLQNAIDRALTPRQQMAITMTLEGLRGVDIARSMDCTKVTVHWLIKRGKENIFLYFAADNPRARRALETALERKYRDPDDDDE